MFVIPLTKDDIDIDLELELFLSSSEEYIPGAVPHEEAPDEDAELIEALIQAVLNGNTEY